MFKPSRREALSLVVLTVVLSPCAYTVGYIACAGRIDAAALCEIAHKGDRVEHVIAEARRQKIELIDERVLRKQPDDPSGYVVNTAPGFTVRKFCKVEFKDKIVTRISKFDGPD